MRWQYFLSVIFFASHIPFPTCSQVYDSSAVHTANYQLNAPYLKSYWYDTRDIMLSPVKWNKNKWIGFGGVVAASTFIYFNDKKIQDIFQNNRSQGGDQFVKYILEPWGSGGVYTLPLIGILYLDGLISDHQRSKKTALLGVKAFLISNLYARIPKYAFQRHRPFQDNPGQPRKWEGPFHGITDFTSFPSGHAVTAFSVAAILASEYADHPAIPIIAYTLAGAVSLSRIYDNKHWASDVILGAAFGYAMGKLIYNRDNWMNGKRKKFITP